MSSLVPQAATAAEPVVSPGATVRLLEGGADTSGTARFGLEIDLEPGWKTYWRSPGEGGFPPEIDFTGSTNLTDATVLWPAPHRQTFLGFETIGYGGKLVLPIDARLADPAAPARLDLKGALYVCSDICTRVDIAFDAVVRAGVAGEPSAAERIAAFRSKVPDDGAASGMAIAGAGFVQTPAGPALQAVATARDAFRAPDLLVETDPPLAFGAPQARFADDRRRVELTLLLAQPLPAGATLAGTSARLTLLDGERAMEAREPISDGPMVGGDAGGWQPEGGPGLVALAGMLATALLGGLILNLMPCVLPVLSLKLISVARHGGTAPREVRLGFLASAAGILASFLVLATAMAGLKAAGAAVGWGIQFQQPLFLVLLVLLLTLFALNLLGAFEIPLPRRLADLIGGRGFGAGGSLAGHFATGAFATLLATPCSAPFLGTAVGFALARGPVEIYAVFAALGLGLALPYLLVAALPRLAARLPKPGRWMLALRRLLSVPLALTAAWLLSVLAAQVGSAAAFLVVALMVALALTLWGAGGGQARSGRLAALTVAALAAAAFLTPLAASRGPAAADAAPRAAAGLDWVRFDTGEIGRRVGAGEVVFVDVTADWCITCKVNERVVLADAAVGRRLAAGDVTPMLADWTRPDPAITAYLQGFGRYGIPFTAVYGPAAPDGIVLPELLTKERVLEALDAAAGRPS
ncbi:protein-disulfide reductase DsbD family protein [Roseomonas sp. E05]|uniref:protein-disulfide reductase DsbD family protein n=1 Tax=Roseomonas sp. E05 TaxID=3046310 RepID=UPI0024B95AC8|nr:protein-disulfide reductase DsbD domain-containing protein [Roseomonas sp. E05]MDJ0391137.1 protein-disulfide reductase DsbD family protein [Roseomonas sp. E05]